MEENKKDRENTKKGKIIIKLLIVVVLLLILGGLYIFKVEVNLFKVSEHAIIDPELPNSYNGFKIVHFSDIHFGRTITNTNLSKIVEKINELKGDVVVFTGDLLDDYINIREDDILNIKENLKNIKAKYRKYAVLGDMDYLDKNLYLEIMDEAGFKVLDNENDLLYIQNEMPLKFIGVSSTLEMQDDLVKALDEDIIPENNFDILLAHEPCIFDSIKGYNLNLVLAGHTLGGLIPFWKNNYLLKQEGVNNYVKGYFENEEHTKMMVNTGVGTSKYNVRFLNKPTINLYRLYNN